MCVCIRVPWQPRNAIGRGRTTLLYTTTRRRRKNSAMNFSFRAAQVAEAYPQYMLCEKVDYSVSQLESCQTKLYLSWLMRMCRSFPVGRSWGCQCHAAAALLALLRSYVRVLFIYMLLVDATNAHRLARVSQYMHLFLVFFCLQGCSSAGEAMNYVATPHKNK
jgi:hypothetical protein